MEDTKHDWVWSLNKGDKVWIAKEESLAKSERFVIDFLDQTGLDEFTSLEEIFMPYEMEVAENWTLKSGDKESHIVSMQYVEPKKFCKLEFAVQSDTRDLLNFFHSRRSIGGDILSTRIFRTKEECEAFCKDNIVMHYTEDYCNDILAELLKFGKRVRGVKLICREEDAKGNGTFFSPTSLDTMLD